MAKYMALYLAALNVTVVVTQYQCYWRMRGLLNGNPFKFRNTMLVEVDHSAVEDLINQTVYGFVPLFRLGKDELAQGLGLVTKLDVGYVSIEGDADYESMPYWSLPLVPQYHNDDLGDGTEPDVEENLEASNGVDSLNYYLATAYGTDVVPDEAEATEHFGEAMMQLPPLAENFEIGSEVQLLGSGGNLATARVVAKNRFGTLCIITGIANWVNSQQSYQARSDKTRRHRETAGLTTVESGKFTHFDSGEPIVYAAPSTETAMRFAVALQPAPGYRYALAQLEAEEFEGQFYPRANANFDFINGQWVPATIKRLANNFGGNIEHGLQQMLNAVGPYTLHVGNVAIDVIGGKVSFETRGVGIISTDADVLVDANSNGF